MLEVDGRLILTTLADKVLPKHTAILVIDMQKDFTIRGMSSESRGRDISGLDRLIQRLRQFVDTARLANIRIVHVAANYDPSYLNDPMYERMHRLGFGHYCISGTDGIQFHVGLEPKSGEPVVVKHRFDAFYATELDLLLRARGVRTVVAVGVAAHGCVYATVAHAYFNGYYVVVPSDLTGLGTRDEVNWALASIRDSYGVTPTALEITEMWNVQTAAGASRQVEQ